MASWGGFTLFLVTIGLASSATIPNSNDELYLPPASKLDNSHFDWLIPIKPLPISPMASPAPSPSESSNSSKIPMPPVAPLEGIKGGYWPSWSIFPPVSIPSSYFTHIFYAFIYINPTSYQLNISKSEDQLMRNFSSTLHAKTPPVKAFLSIAASNASIFSSMASDQGKRARFIKSTIEVAREYGFDGVEIDWEFPKDAQDMSNLSLLFSEWSTAVLSEAKNSNQPRLLLAAAVYFASKFFMEDGRSYPTDAIKDYLDFVNLMCFNYHGNWDTSKTGEHALLYDNTSKISTSYGISTWTEAGVPPGKLVMGLPMYGWTWHLKDPNVHGIGAPAVGVGLGENGIMSYDYIVKYNSNNSAIVFYDNVTVSTYSYAGTNWVGYDGPNSTQSKVDYAKAQSLGGYFFWALNQDRNWSLSRASNPFSSEAWDTEGTQSAGGTQSSEGTKSSGSIDVSVSPCLSLSLFLFTSLCL